MITGSIGIISRHVARPDGTPVERANAHACELMRRIAPVHCAPVHWLQIDSAGPDLHGKSWHQVRAWAQEKASDLIFVDAALAGLAAMLVDLPARLVLREDGGNDWRRLMAARPFSAEINQYHFNAITDPEQYRDCFDGCLAADLYPAMPMSATVPAGPRAGLVCPATGISWLDRRIAAWANKDASLIGFDPALSAGRIALGWEDLMPAIATARGVFMPYITPELFPLIDAALANGTPVLTQARDAAAWQISDRAGIILMDELPASGPVPAAASKKMVVLDNAGLAKATQPANRMEDRFMQWFMQSLLIRSGRRRIRQSVLTEGELALSYNSATRLLLLAMTLADTNLVEDVSLLDRNGMELTRLMPDENRIEGGIVIAPDELAAGLSLTFNNGEAVLDVLFIPGDAVSLVTGEMSTFETDNLRMNGTFWVHDVPGVSYWQILRNGKTFIRVERKAGIPFADLGLLALPFSQNLPADDIVPEDVFHIVPEDDTDFPVQRPLTLPKRLIRGDRRTTVALEALRDRHKGKRAWIIGNGPSVRLEDLDAIPADDIVFCFNRFYLGYDKTSLREDYVVSADTLMIEDFGQEMIDISSGLPLFCQEAESLSDLTGAFIGLTPGNSYLPVFSKNPGHFVSIGGSSVYVALQMAWFMGIRDVVLYGIDYSFKTELKRDSRYNFPVATNDGNHFIKAYRGDRPWCPPTWRDIATGFLNARIAYELAGGRIRNATRGGRLETFPRIDFDALTVPRTEAG